MKPGKNKIIYSVVSTTETAGHGSVYHDVEIVASATSRELAERLAIGHIEHLKLYDPDEYDSYKAMVDDGADLSGLIGRTLTDGDADTMGIRVEVKHSELHTIHTGEDDRPVRVMYNGRMTVMPASKAIAYYEEGVACCEGAERDDLLDTIDDIKAGRRDV